jgi:hypothetical protein
VHRPPDWRATDDRVGVWSSDEVATEQQLCVYRGVLPLRCCNLARRHGSLEAPCPNHHYGLTSLIFWRQSHLIAGELQYDRTGHSCGSKIQHTPIDGDLPRADSEQPAKIDDSRVNVTIAADDDIHDASHVLFGAAAHALPENRGDLLIVEYYRRRTGKGSGGGAAGGSAGTADVELSGPGCPAGGGFGVCASWLS